MATRWRAGIRRGRRPRRATTSRAGITRRIHHRTLLGIHGARRTLHPIPGRTPSLARLARDRCAVQGRCCRSLRRRLRACTFRSACFRLHRRRFTRQGATRKPASLAQRFRTIATPPPCNTLPLSPPNEPSTRAAQTGGCRRGDNNRPRSPYRCAVSPARAEACPEPARSQASTSGRAGSNRKVRSH